LSESGFAGLEEKKDGMSESGFSRLKD